MRVNELTLVSFLGNIYTDDHVTLIEGDCLEKLKEMPENSVDIVVTSPPYNIGINYADYTDDKEDDAFLEWMSSISRELARIVKKGGHAFVNVGYTNKKPWISHDVAQQFRRDWVLQNRFVWVKSISIENKTTGNFKPINSPRYVSLTNEDVYHFTHDGTVAIVRKAIGVPFMHKGNMERFGHVEDLRCRGNTWFVPFTPINDAGKRGGGHPATFPLELPLMCIRLTGITDGVVMDPFVGSGTVMQAARKCGMRGVGIDISPTYLAHASPEKSWPPR